jgi:hypothetical protein
MADDKTKAGKADRIRVNVNQKHELRRWCEAFGVTKGTLQEAVKAVGPMVADVKKYLIDRIAAA